MRPGLGLVGMRERAAASGGVLEAGPRGRGGFLVRLRVPLAAPVGTGAPRAGVGA
jgi:signal transduction histidine kinase